MKKHRARREFPAGAVVYWVRKPPALPVEVSRKKALALSNERSELLTTRYQ